MCKPFMPLLNVDVIMMNKNPPNVHHCQPFINQIRIPEIEYKTRVLFGKNSTAWWKWLLHFRHNLQYIQSYYTRI